MIAVAAALPARDPNLPRSFWRDADGRVAQDLGVRELEQAAASGTGNLWVDVDTSNRHQVAFLERVFRFHHLAIEDTLNPRTRVKLEEYPGFLFLVVRNVRFCETTEDPYDTETFNLYCFVGRNFLVTVHGEHAPSVEEVIHRVERSPDLLGRGVQRLLHAVLDGSVDAYFPVIDQIDDFANGLEERVFERFDEGALRDIFLVKRLVLQLRRHLAPEREVFNILSNRPTEFLTPETQIYFRDIYDHLLRITESLDNYRDLLSSTLDSYLSQVSNQLGRVTKGLSAVATLSIPFVMVSGMWGMNFSRIPLAHHPAGFWIMLALQLGLGVALVLILRRNRLL